MGRKASNKNGIYCACVALRNDLRQQSTYVSSDSIVFTSKNIEEIKRIERIEAYIDMCPMGLTVSRMEYEYSTAQVYGSVRRDPRAFTMTYDDR